MIRKRDKIIRVMTKMRATNLTLKSRLASCLRDVIWRIKHNDKCDKWQIFWISLKRYISESHRGKSLVILHRCIRSGEYQRTKPQTW